MLKIKISGNSVPAFPSSKGGGMLCVETAHNELAQLRHNVEMYYNEIS